MVSTHHSSKDLNSLIWQICVQTKTDHGNQKTNIVKQDADEKVKAAHGTNDSMHACKLDASNYKQ